MGFWNSVGGGIKDWGSNIGDAASTIPIVGGLMGLESPEEKGERQLRKGLAGAESQFTPVYQQAAQSYAPYADMAQAYPQLQQQVQGGAFQGQVRDVGGYQQPGMEDFQYNFQQDPGYQFARDEGLGAIERQMAARGLSGSSQEQKNMMKYATGLAGQQYGQGHARAMQEHQARQGQRMGLAGMGQRSYEFGAGMQRQQDQLRNQYLQQNLQNRMGLAGVGMGALGAQTGYNVGLAGKLADLEMGRGQAGATRYMGEAAGARGFMSDVAGAAGQITTGGAAKPQGLANANQAMQANQMQPPSYHSLTPGMDY